ncbi:hypothetical protein VTH82DRAFT_2508 [Thermothelomyces myriococcoides]
MPADNDSTAAWASKAEQAAQEDQRAQPWKEVLSNVHDGEPKPSDQNPSSDHAQSNQPDKSACSVCGNSSCNSCDAPTVAG